jgi:Subtilase family
MNAAADMKSERMMKRNLYGRLFVAVAVVLLCAAAVGRAENTVTWQSRSNLVSADIKGAQLFPVLEKVATESGWHIYVEPDAARTVSVKFKNLPTGEALHLLLGDLNFAMVPETNASPKLYVFRTRMENATRLVQPVKAVAKKDDKPKKIPNELIVRLKPGVKIDELARLLGAKVIGHIDSLNAYRLQFDSSDATDAAQAQLASNSDVASVESNYSLPAPEVPQQVTVPGGGVPPIQLTLNPPPSNGRTIIGLVDTAIQEPLPNGLDSFLQQPISVAGDAQLDPNSPSHGTSMAETMLRTLQALGNGSTSVQILPVDVYGPNPTTSTFDVAQGYAAAVNGGAQIINLSLGSGSDSQMLQDLITQAYQKGIVTFAAKGNTPVTTPFYPAADQNVFAVTALQSDGSVAPWANEASIPAIGAMGTVVVPYDGQTFMVQGTSPATAIASATDAAGVTMGAGIFSTGTDQTGGLSPLQIAQDLFKTPTKTTIPNK